MQPIAAKRNITIDLQTADNADAVTLDLRKLKQVLYNLLSNAIKFSHDEGVVKLAIRLDAQEQLQIEVKDSGIGIKRDDLHRIFREFEQVESGASRRFPGTGLGLALTKRIIELQNGSVLVESEFGKGSTFTITMPRTVDLAQKPAMRDMHTSREL